MSNEKISIQELVDVIAQQAGTSKKKAEEFLKVFQGTIEEGLVNDRLVKIKGFGTFKLIWNEARKSVNVQTGKEYIIPGHTKVTFTPEATTKELINNPGGYKKPAAKKASPKKVEQAKGTDPLAKLNKEAEEIKEIIADIKDMKKSDEKTSQKDVQEKKDIVPEMVKPTEEKDPNESIQHAALTEKHVLKERDIPVKPKGKGKKIVVLVLILLIIAGGVGAYMFYKEPIISLKDKVVAKVEAMKTKAAQEKEDIDEDLVSEEETVVESPVVKEEDIKTETTPKVEEKQKVEQVKNKPVVSVFNKNRDYKSIKATEVIKKGDRLVLIAEKYYGHKDFWVYIYEANRAVLKSPGSVFVGMKIKVPNLNPALIDLKNPAVLKYAKRLENKYLGY